MSGLRLELPFPPKELSPNSRLGWRAKAQVVRLYREDCGWTAHGAILQGAFARTPLRPPVEATVTFVVPDRRKRDLDNLCAMLKPAWDGLTDAGVLAGDDHTQFKVADASVVVRNKENACVEVILRGDSG